MLINKYVLTPLMECIDLLDIRLKQAKSNIKSRHSLVVPDKSVHHEKTENKNSLRFSTMFTVEKFDVFSEELDEQTIGLTGKLNLFVVVRPAANIPKICEVPDFVFVPQLFKNFHPVYVSNAIENHVDEMQSE